ncbi:MAG: hypothetical protein K0B08_01810 [Bacteroidales bacterium]|nr:hypothetical protein [Bacteroidales bacterium]
MKQKHEAGSAEEADEPVTNEITEESIPDKTEKTFQPAQFSTPEEPERRRRSVRMAWKQFLMNRAIRKEERIKRRIRREIHRKQLKEYRKLEAGQSVLNRLFRGSDDEEQTEKSKSVSLFSQRSAFYRNLTFVVNSITVFIATYVLVYLFYWLTSMLVASWYGLDSILYYYDLKFNDHSNLWTRFNILMVTGIPPFFCLFLGIFLFRVVFKNPSLVGLQKLFVLWTSFHLFNHFFGALPSGIVTSEGFGYVAAWMYMNTAIKFLFSLISLFALGLIGYYSAEHILETSDSVHRIKKENRMTFMLIQMAIPWLIGTIIMLLVRHPMGFKYPYETLMLFSIAFLVIPPFFNQKVKPKLNLVKVKKKRHIHIGYLLMMLLLLSFLRIMLGIGLHFIIKINISISPAV